MAGPLNSNCPWSGVSTHSTFMLSLIGSPGIERMDCWAPPGNISFGCLTMLRLLCLWRPTSFTSQDKPKVDVLVQEKLPISPSLMLIEWGRVINSILNNHHAWSALTLYNRTQTRMIQQQFQTCSEFTLSFRKCSNKCFKNGQNQQSPKFILHGPISIIVSRLACGR